ncbi:hypothetical protein BaRGS_00011523 [Batillaria attramentaria]|uniref:Osteopetrosis-associated transmembrane protein 1 n=1 Tax=Batillaria attramentaria TaxID=370345 RepID=A0ABD0LDZ3_9CAEN
MYIGLIILAAFVSVSSADRVREFRPADALEPIERLREQRVGDDSLLNSLLSSSLNDLIGLREPFTNTTDSCKAILVHYADQASNFTKCLLSHARPFRLCEKCIEHYTRATNLYNDLLSDSKCSSVLLLADRMQVMSSTYKSFVSLWEGADCGKCFDNVEENATTGVVTFSFTAETMEFQLKHKNMSACVNDTSGWDLLDQDNATQCTECRDIYRQLNRQFENMRSKSHGHVCMDLVDMMNYTRLMWSTKFGCRRPAADTKLVIMMTVLVCFFTAVLYLGSRFNAKIRMPQIFKGKRMVGVTHYGATGQSRAGLTDSSSRAATPLSETFSSSNNIST